MGENIYLCKNKDTIEMRQEYEDFYGDKVKVIHICGEDDMNFDETGRRKPIFVSRKKKDGTTKYHFIPVHAFVSRRENRNNESNKRITPIVTESTSESTKFLSLDVSKEFDTITINLK